MTIDQLSETRRTILLAIKQKISSNIAGLAEYLKISKEGVRLHIEWLERRGWISPALQRAYSLKGGRPQSAYSLTPAGEELFPKSYDNLAIAIIDTTAQELGIDALRKVLSSLTESRVQAWMPRLEGLPLHEKIALLKEIYAENDPFTSIEQTPDGYRLVESNCPFYNVAMQRPALCSLTVMTLTRLLGVRVIREEKFQNGDGRCAFRVMAEQPVQIQNFAFENELARAA